jgi:group I intron endonuclease
VGARRPDAEGSHKVGTLINKKYSSSIVITPKSVNEVVRLNTIRAFSTSGTALVEKAYHNSDKSSNKYSSDFWKKHYRLDESDINNPLTIVNNFLKQNASLKKDIVKKYIDLNIINAIIRGLGKDELSSNEFKGLKNIKPVRFNLPLDNRDATLLSKLIGTKGHIFNSKPGAYVLTNKINGHTYVGSTISLANRLFNNYLKIGTKDNRVIIKAIKDIGVENFTVDVYLIPKEWIGLALLFYCEQVGTYSDPLITNKAKAAYIERMKYYYLALEQMLILEFNPEYNTLKVPYSNAGHKRSLEAITNSALKKSKVTYLYDIKIKQLIYIANSRSELSKISKNITMYINGKLYLNQFIFSNNLLSEEDYITKLMSPDSLSAYIHEVKTRWKRESISKASEARKLSVQNKLIPVKLINTQSNEVTVHNSIGDAARYLQQLNPLYKKAHPGALTGSAKRGSLYKGVFLVQYFNDKEG